MNEGGKKKNWFGRSKGPKPPTDKHNQRSRITVPRNSDEPKATEANSEGQGPVTPTGLNRGQLTDTPTPKAINKPDVLGTGTLFKKLQ